MRFTSSQFRNLIFCLLIFVLGGVVGYRLQMTKGGAGESKLPQFKLTGLTQPAELKDVNFGMFWEVWQILERDYLDKNKLDQQKMVDGAIQGMTAALGDPYTMYLPPVEQKRTQEDLSGAFFGVGIQLGYIDETLAVVAPIKGGPAELKGVKAGDLILHVKDAANNLDSDTNGWSLPQAVNNIRGDKGTTVTLTLFRKNNGNEPMVVDIVRDEILVPSVEFEEVEHQGKKVAHITLSRFGERTTEEFNDIISKILIDRPQLAGIVLDLRNNPGGFFDGAIDVASEFIDDGVVVSQQTKVAKEDFKAKGKARLSSIPLVVIVNRGSASASEIVAGALRDQKQAKLVGEKSFGKGTVQDARQLSSGAGLHVTIARWLLPKGSWIHETGIPVDVEVKDDTNTTEDEVLLKAIEQL